MKPKMFAIWPFTQKFVEHCLNAVSVNTKNADIFFYVKGCCYEQHPVNDAGILGLWRRDIQPVASDEAGLPELFV